LGDRAALPASEEGGDLGALAGPKPTELADGRLCSVLPLTRRPTGQLKYDPRHLGASAAPEVPDGPPHRGA
jgi:hypothetical protein